MKNQLLPERPLTTEQAAHFLGVSQGHLANMRSRGEGPRYIQRSRKGRVLYLRDDLEKYLDKHTFVAVSQADVYFLGQTQHV